MGALTVSRPEPLSAGHDLDPFDCGVAPLDAWLKRRAFKNETEGASRSFVLSENMRVFAYYSLAAGSIFHGVATNRTRRNMPDPVPAILLARLAVDRQWQGKGLGADLLGDAILRVLGAAETIGVRAILVHALSDEARGFYEKHGFRRSAVDPMTLMITLDEAQRMLQPR